LYRDTYRRELESAGIATREVEIKNGKSFEIVGIPVELTRALSTRRQQIEAVVTPEDSAKEVQEKVLATRDRKRAIDRVELDTRWQEVATSLGFDHQSFIESLTKEPEAVKDKETRKEKEKEKKKEAKQEKEKSQGKKKTKSQEKEKNEQQREAKEDRRTKPPEYEEAKAFFAALEEALRALGKEARAAREEKYRAYINKQFERLKKKQKWFKWRITILYILGKVSRAKYLKIVKGKGLPKTKFGINFAYATYKISGKEHRQLLKKHGHVPKDYGLPKTRLKATVAFAFGQISEWEYLTVLSRLGPPPTLTERIPKWGEIRQKMRALIRMKRKERVRERNYERER
jgi:outer membrane biosynthesis protein TonB